MCGSWDYLRRSGQGGFFLPLSGGVDSSSTATIVHAMCRMIVNSIQCGDIQVLDDVRKILGDPQFVPDNAAALCNRLLVTCYMGGQNSSEKTRKLASTLVCKQINMNYAHFSHGNRFYRCAFLK